MRLTAQEFRHTRQHVTSPDVVWDEQVVDYSDRALNSRNFGDDDDGEVAKKRLRPRMTCCLTVFMALSIPFFT